MAKQTNMKTLSDGELTALLAQKHGDLHTLRFEAAGSRPKDPNGPSKVRRDVARILTEQRARHISK